MTSLSEPEFSFLPSSSSSSPFPTVDPLSPFPTAPPSPPSSSNCSAPDPPSSSSSSPPRYNFYAVLLVLLIFCVVFGNVLVCAAVRGERALQTTTNYLIVSLAVSDLLLATLVMPWGVYLEMFGVFIICWLPFFLTHVLKAHCGTACCVPPTLYSSVTWLGYLNSAVNPVIYTTFNIEFRKAFQKILHC
ncbi:unnamed protein product [Boreogadus saida]